MFLDLFNCLIFAHKWENLGEYQGRILSESQLNFLIVIYFQEATRCCKLRELPPVLNLQLNRCKVRLKTERE